MRNLFLFVLFFLPGAELRGDGAKGTACDWALEAMSMKALDEIQGQLDSEGRLVYMTMFDTIEVEKGSACSSGGGSVCTVMAIINKNTGRVKMAHLAGKSHHTAEAFIKQALADLGGEAEAKNIQVVMAGNQAAATKIDDDYEYEVQASKDFEKTINGAFSAGGVKAAQVKSYLSSNTEEYAYDLTVDTQEKKIYVGRKKVKLLPNDPSLLRRR